MSAQQFLLRSLLAWLNERRFVDCHQGLSPALVHRRLEAVPNFQVAGLVTTRAKVEFLECLWIVPSNPAGVLSRD